MEQHVVIASLSSGYDEEIHCYKKLLKSLQKTKEELKSDHFDKVLKLQQSQKNLMELIETTEKRLNPYKTEWERFKKTAAGSSEGRALLEKIGEIESLLSQILSLEDEAINDLGNRKLIKSKQIKNHREKKNGHLAYRKAGPVEAMFWDRKS